MGQLDAVVLQARDGGADIALSELGVDGGRAGLRGVLREEGIIALVGAVGHVGEYHVGAKLTVALGDVALNGRDDRLRVGDLVVQSAEIDLRFVVLLTQKFDLAVDAVDLAQQRRGLGSIVRERRRTRGPWRNSRSANGHCDDSHHGNNPPERLKSTR